MAKKQAFGEEAQALKESQRKMAKVIVATLNERGKYAYRETMMDQGDVQEYIKANRG